MKITGPLFKWFGSKWLSSKTLPKPECKRIIEPFAGSAGYSLRHVEHDVILYERNKQIHDLWSWLISGATQSDILAIPVNVKEGTDIRRLALSYGQSLLLKTWQRTNNVGDCWTISPWGNKPGQFTINTRSRVADEFQAIKHWKIIGENGLLAFDNSHSTWFIDPPYQYNYQYKTSAIDYIFLSDKIRQCKGQVIVCEALCQKTGAIPKWLPFEFWADRITSRRKTGNNHHSRELIYIQ